jgi:protein gp37
MEMANWHTFQVLTKRHERMRELLSGKLGRMAALPNIWWGVSVENRRDGRPRVEALRQTPAVVRWLPIEPLLEDLGIIDLSSIDWVVIGGESGLGARRMELEWIRSLPEQCVDAGVPCFVKQLGERWARVNGFVGKGITQGGEP